MKRYNITVNGKSYDVTVDEIAAGAPVAQAAPAAPAAAAAPAPAPVAAPAPAAAPSAQVSAGAFKLTSPLPGKILDIKVSVGDSVSKNQVGVIIEAMKMENEIVIPQAGKVTSVTVTKGATINAGDVLLTVE